MGLFIYKELSLKDFFYIPEENGDAIDDEVIISQIKSFDEVLFFNKIFLWLKLW